MCMCMPPWQAEQLDLLTPDAPQFRPTGWSALHLLANRPDPWKQRAELAQLLLNKSADPMRLTARRGTPLHTAAGTANFEVAKVLVNHPGTEVNAKNKDNKHPWDCARHNATMRQLLEAYGGIESGDKTGGSSRDEVNARRGGPSSKRLERAQQWRGRR